MARGSDIKAAAVAVMDDVAAIEVTELAGGSSAFVAKLLLTSAGGAVRTVAFRQHVDKVRKGHRPEVSAKEFHLTSELQRWGVPVAAPLALHDGNYEDGPWLVTELVAGSNAIGQMDAPSLIDEMADHLARIHDLEPSRFDPAMVDQIEDPLDALPRYLPDDALGRTIRSAFLDRSMRNLNEICLLHGDYWPGNVMVKDRCVVAILDWEDAKVGDPLVDVACARVELACDGGRSAVERFTDRYREVCPSVALDDLAIWDIYVSATALSGMHLWGLSEQAEAKRRSTTYDFLADASRRLASRP